MLSCETAGWRNLVSDLPSPSSPRRLPPSWPTAAKGSAMSLMRMSWHCRVIVMLVSLFVEPSCSRDGRRQQQEDNLEEKNDIKLRKAKKSLVPTWWSGLPSTYLIRPSLKHIWSGLHTFNIFDQTYLQLIWSDLPSTYLIRLTFNFVQTNPISSLAPPPSLCPGSSTVISPLENKQNSR